MKKIRFFVLIFFLVPFSLFAYVIVDTSDIEPLVVLFIGDFLNERASALGVTLSWEEFPYSIEPDVLIHNLPVAPFSPDESDWLREWVFSGGTLVLGGEHRIYRDSNEIINDLLGSGGFGLQDSIVSTWVVDTSRWIDHRDYWYTVDPNPRDNLVFASDSFIVFAGAYLVLGSTAKPLLVLGDSAHSDYGRVGRQPNASQIHYGDGQILLFADENVLFIDADSLRESLYLSYCNGHLLNRILLIGTEEIEEDDRHSIDFSLSAHPNPFNSAVTISFDYGSESAQAVSTIEVFDMNGRRVAELPDDGTLGEALVAFRNVACGVSEREGTSTSPTTREFTWRPAASLASGVYLVRARFDTRSLSGVETTATKRVVYLK